MAERRMFSKRIVSSARFLKMPISSQALYFHLCINADDDGVVEAYTVIRWTGATEDDLRVLVAKGFVKVLNDDLVAYIVDWRENNKIRADRKIDSIYKPLLLSVEPDVDLLEPKERADLKKKREMDNQWTSNGHQVDGIGKDSIGKDSIGKVNNNTSTEADEIDEAFDKIYSIYPKKVGKTKAKARHRQWLKGRKVNGKTVKLTNAQIWKAVAKYVRSKEGSELRFYKDFNVLLGDCLLDYVEDEE